MTRDRNCQSIRRTGPGDRMHGLRCTDSISDFGIAPRCAHWYIAQRFPDTLLKRGAANIEWKIQPYHRSFDETDHRGNGRLEIFITARPVKGKTHKRYELGVKVSIATTNRSNLVVGAQSLPGNPYDGHTLSSALHQVERLTGQRPERCYVDLGYRGHDVNDVEVFKARQKRGVTPSIRRELKRRNAVEPIIGHMKNDGLMGRNYLKCIERKLENGTLTTKQFT